MNLIVIPVAILSFPSSRDSKHAPQSHRGHMVYIYYIYVAYVLYVVYMSYVCCIYVVDFVYTLFILCISPYDRMLTFPMQIFRLWSYVAVCCAVITSNGGGVSVFRCFDYRVVSSPTSIALMVVDCVQIVWLLTVMASGLLWMGDYWCLGCVGWSGVGVPMGPPRRRYVHFCY